jgi:hypothetical protein
MRLANLLVVGKELAVGLESGLVRVFNMALPYPSSTIVWRSISQGTSISSLNWNEYDSVASKEELVSGPATPNSNRDAKYSLISSFILAFWH